MEVVQASRTFPRRGAPALLALKPTALSVAAGQFVSLVGPSGCGKTTLLRLIAGLDHPSSGSVEVDGERVLSPRPSVGVMFQRPALLEWYTVERNVLLPAVVAGELNAGVRRRARELLDLAGLADFANAYPSELSGGMQQRVAIVRSLIRDPGLLLMDEPFSALDEFTREALADELLRLRGTHPSTVIFVTHNIAEAIYLSDRVVVMSNRPGRVVADVEVSLPRPRTSAVRNRTEFHELVTQVRCALNA